MWEKKRSFAWTLGAIEVVGILMIRVEDLRRNEQILNVT